MIFPDLEKSDLVKICRQITELTAVSQLSLGKIEVVQKDNSLLKITASLLEDRILGVQLQERDFQIAVTVTIFCNSPETDREVLWTQVSYSLPRERSHFFPVPEDFGPRVGITFDWEFDRETLEIGAAGVRERGSLHFVSVLPNADIVRFVEICSEIGEQWV